MDPCETSFTVVKPAMNMAREGFATFLGGQLGWGERKYVQTMYGVTATQAANTSFKQYMPQGGFYEAQATVNWEHRFDARWGINTLVGVEHRMGDAAKSPIVQRKTSPIGAVYVTYRY